MMIVLRRVVITLSVLAGLSLSIFCIAMFGMLQPKFPPAPHWTLWHEIKTADLVTIDKYKNNYVNNFLYLDSKHYYVMLLLLRKSNHFHSSPPQAEPDLTLNIEQSDGKVNESETGPVPFPMYKYVVETGELGQDHEWCYVPPEFREWMKKVLANPPKVVYDSGGRMKDANDVAGSSQ